MKKILTVFFTILLSTVSFGQLTTVWERCLRTGAAESRPAWFGTGTERGIAYGNMGSGERLYVVSRNGGSNIRVLNPNTGADVTLGTPFDMATVSGGTFAVNDVEMSSDNVLFVCNLASSSFKLYWWTAEGGAPAGSNTFTLPTVTGIRYGDKITVLGSWTAGTLEVWVPGAGVAAVGAIQVLRTTNQGANWTTTQVTLSGTYTNTVAAAQAAPLSVGGSFYLAGNGAVPRLHGIDGAYTASSLFSSATSSRASIKAFTVGGKKFLAAATYRHEAVITGNTYTRSYLYDVTTPSSVTMYGFTPLLADSGVTNYANASNSDIVVRDNGDNTATIFVLGTDQGIGSYTTSGSPLPVELSSFTSSVSGQSVNLSWSTATEIDNYGFEVQKSENQSEWNMIGFVHGSGNSNSNKQYAYTDQQAGTGTVYYRLKQIDNAGTFKVYDPIAVEVEIPKDFTLSQNYPNPFNPATTINYTLPTAGSVTLQVYAMNGELVQTLVQGHQAAGSYAVAFDASRLASGTYAYRLITTGADGQTQSALKKMLLMK